jgi:hypothetical protein
MSTLKTYSTIDLHETNFYETNGLQSRIEIQRGKAVFVFSITQDLVDLKSEFSNPSTKVNLQEFLQALSNLKRRMYSSILQKETEKK